MYNALSIQLFVLFDIYLIDWGNGIYMAKLFGGYYKNFERYFTK